MTTRNHLPSVATLLVMLVWVGFTYGEFAATAVSYDLPRTEASLLTTAVIGNANYTILKKSVDFHTALKECSKLGAFLTDIKDLREKETLVKLIKSAIPSYKWGLWVSGLPIGRKGSPIWLNTGKAIDKNLWNRNGMNTKGCTETCTALFWRYSQTGISYIWCHAPRYFICKRQLL